MNSELDTPIGTRSKQRLSAGSVIVASVTIEEKQTRKGGKAKLVVFNCNHPDREDSIALSNVKMKKVQGNNETIMKDTLWYSVDQDGNIPQDSVLAHVMRFYKKETLKGFIGTLITTESDALGYLAIKAY